MNEELKRIKEKYEERGRDKHRYTLSGLDDLKAIHGIDVEQIKGFNKYDLGVQDMLRKFIVNFYNRQGLEVRMEIEPLSFDVYMKRMRFNMKKGGKKSHCIILGPSHWA